MSVLSDKDIMERWEEIFPYTDNFIYCLHNIQPASVDLQLGHVVKTIDDEKFYLNERSMYVLQPGEFILKDNHNYFRKYFHAGPYCESREDIWNNIQYRL